ncbi:invasion associated locus B family protein [Roseovarius sp. MBR-6]|jgi:invasion protein IalB|uniref:invasion associated locus B family protein n=1 Tax=Roseovarius sp. MBR-6 TaxID=3156459 RepID=UPI0033926FA3
MSKTVFRLTLAALLAVSTAAGAQQAESPAGDAQTDAAPAQTEAPVNPVPGLDTGRVVDDENAPYIRETHGDWSMRCFPNEVEGQGDDLCQMYQLLTEEAGNPVAEISIYRLAGGGQVVAGATLAVPLGTLLTEEVKLSVDSGKAKSYAYSFCTMAGCFSRIGLAQVDIDAMKRGSKATIEIVPAQAPDQIVRIDASLVGFTAAFEATSTITN